MADKVVFVVIAGSVVDFIRLVKSVNETRFISFFLIFNDINKSFFTVNDAVIISVAGNRKNASFLAKRNNCENVSFSAPGNVSDILLVIRSSRSGDDA